MSQRSNDQRTRAFGPPGQEYRSHVRESRRGWTDSEVAQEIDAALKRNREAPDEFKLPIWSAVLLARARDHLWRRKP